MHKIPQGVSEASFSPCTIFQEKFEGRPLPFFGQAVNATFAVVSFDAHCCELRVGPLTLQRYDFLAAGWRNGRIAGEELVYFPTPKIDIFLEFPLMRSRAPNVRTYLDAHPSLQLVNLHSWYVPELGWSVILWAVAMGVKQSSTGIHVQVL